MQRNHKARSLRRASTTAEQAFWHHVRDRQPGGHRFRRQVPIGPYVADFVCPAARLIVELDSGQHQKQVAADEHRTQWLANEGYRVFRVWNNDVLGNMAGVLETVLAELGGAVK